LEGGVGRVASVKLQTIEPGTGIASDDLGADGPGKIINGIVELRLRRTSNSSGMR